MIYPLIVIIILLLCSSIKKENLSAKKPSGETKSSPKTEPSAESKYDLKPQVIEENKNLLNDVLQEKSYTADDKIFNASILSGFKDRIAKENRSKWNNDNWKKYYDYELGAHEQSNRDWWSNDDFELTRAGHVVI